MRLRTCYLAIALSAVAPWQSLAAAPDVKARADELFKQGLAASDQGDCSTALGLFRTSYELVPSTGRLMNMAVCEAELGMVATAYAHFQEVAKQLPKGDDRRPTVDDYLAKLPARIPHLRLDLAPGAPADSHVTLDGAPVSTEDLGTDIAVDPGKHVVVVTAAGRPERRYDVVSAGGKQVVLSVAPGAAPDVPDAPSASKRSLAPPFVLGGAGVVGLAAGAGFLALREGKVAEATELRALILADHRSCIPEAANYDGVWCPGLTGATSAGDTFLTAAVISFVAGGLAVGSAAVYMLWPGPKADPSAGVSVRLAPIVGAREQGVVVLGSF